jgi:hypothetical protein
MKLFTTGLVILLLATGGMIYGSMKVTHYDFNKIIRDAL